MTQQFHSYYIPNRNLCPRMPKDMYRNIHSSIINNGPKPKQLKYPEAVKMDELWCIQRKEYSTTIKMNKL